MNKCWMNCRVQWKSEWLHVRMWIALAVAGYYLYELTENYLLFGAANQIPVSVWIFPFLTSTIAPQSLFAILAVFLFSKAPFWREGSAWYLQRCGKTEFFLGHMLFILLQALLLAVSLAFFSLLPLISRPDFDNHWGKAINTLIYTDASLTYRLSFSVGTKIVVSYSPWQAELLAVLLEWGLFSFLGMVIYCFNLISRGNAGTVLAASFVFLDLAIYNVLPVALYHFSPVSLAKLGLLQDKYSVEYPSIRYAVFFFMAGFLLLSLLTWFCLKRRKGNPYEF